MSRQSARMLEEAKKLPPIERAELIDGLLDSFNLEQMKRIDEAWANEAESRIDAYEAGRIEEIPLCRPLSRR